MTARCRHDRFPPWMPPGSRHWYCCDCGYRVPPPTKKGLTPEERADIDACDEDD